MYLFNKCAISGKTIKKNDDVICFPCFDSHLNEPEFACYEGIALRSEFEKWYLRDSVVKKVRDVWVEEYHTSEYSIILAENENFLIGKSKVEDRVSLFFLNHVRFVDFTNDTWKRFQELVTADKGNIHINQRDTLRWSVDISKDNVMIQVRIIRRDTITISMAEWEDLQGLLPVGR